MQLLKLLTHCEDHLIHFRNAVVPHCFGFGAKTFDKSSSLVNGRWTGGSYKVTIYVATVPSFLFATA